MSTAKYAYMIHLIGSSAIRTPERAVCGTHAYISYKNTRNSLESRWHAGATPRRPLSHRSVLQVLAHAEPVVDEVRQDGGDAPQELVAEVGGAEGRAVADPAHRRARVRVGRRRDEEHGEAPGLPSLRQNRHHPGRHVERSLHEMKC